MMRPWKALISAEKEPLLIGVSGGADSMALAYLASRWTDVFAIIVDHALRKESMEEAALTASRLLQLGIKNRIVRMDPLLYPKGVGKQERARFARFEVFHHLAKELKAGVIALAHHQGDQDETVYMRWKGESRKFGLTGIEPLMSRGGFLVLHPLLTVPKARLCKTLSEKGIEWCEDPSNQSRSYERVRVRQDISPLKRQQSRCLAQLAKCNVIFDRYILLETWQKYFRWHEEAGWVEISDLFFSNVPSRIAILLLRYVIQLITAGQHKPSFKSTASLYLARSGTLGGVQLKRKTKHFLNSSYSFFMVREVRDLPILPLSSLYSKNYEQSHLWAGTWSWTGNVLEAIDLEVRPLAELKRKIRQKKLPFEVAKTMPSLWEKDKFLGCPLLEGLPEDFIKQPFKWEGRDFLELIGLRK
ncbi:tRNA lysidine(34) synthetase TilS [Acetobacteraceae bacterium]|nr:tRNA lysidine(34) synthetase TilS [Acetobacteraceae bacterium]